MRRESAGNFSRCCKACFEKCFGKLCARWKRHQARIHAEEARVLFEAVAALPRSSNRMMSALFMVCITHSYARLAMVFATILLV
jgi:hypothetical protein